jgi:predicted RNA-binding protein
MKIPEILVKDFIGINGVGRNQLIHPHFEIWQSCLKDNYIIKDNIKMIVFVPCAAIKPYYNSPIHRTFNEVIEKYNNIQRFVISNAGIIAYEFCNRYPFDSYDWNPLLETPEIKQEFIEVTSKRIFEFFNTKKINNKVKFITYLRNDSESLKSLRIAFNKLKFNLEPIKISGKLHETADTDLLLILEENLTRLDKKLKSLK